MSEPARTVALLVANPALSSILSVVLAAMPSLRVRSFESLTALSTYMRVVPVDLVIADFDCPDASADAVARALRADGGLESPHFQFIALASTVTGETKEACLRAGIDEVVVKPMSPKYLLERVLARLRTRPPVPSARVAPKRVPGHVFYNDPKIVPLFRPPQPLH